VENGLFRTFSHFFDDFFDHIRSYSILGAFLGFFGRFFLAILSDFGLIFCGFWLIMGWFSRRFSMIFQNFDENCDLVKIVIFPREN